LDFLEGSDPAKDRGDVNRQQSSSGPDLRVSAHQVYDGNRAGGRRGNTGDIFQPKMLTCRLPNIGTNKVQGVAIIAVDY
jgi:hypothetical protein